MPVPSVTGTVGSVLRRDEALELIEPVEDEVKLSGARFLLTLDHEEPLAVGGNIIMSQRPSRRGLQISPREKSTRSSGG